MDAFLRSTSIHSVGRYLISQGIAPRDVLRDVAIAPESLLDSRIWLDRDKVLHLCQALVDQTGNPLAVLGTLERFKIDEYGHWVERLFAKDNLLQALRFMCLNVSSIETGTRLILINHGDTVKLRVELVGALERSPDLYHEGVLLNLLAVLRATAECFPVTVCLVEAAHDRSAIECTYTTAVAFRSRTMNCSSPAQRWNCRCE